FGKCAEPRRRQRPDRRNHRRHRARGRGGRRGDAALGNRQRPGLRVCVPAGRGGDRRLLRLPGDGALLGALFVLAQPEARATWRAGFIFSLIPLAISIYLFAAFDPARANYQFVEQLAWIPQFGISYHLGMDGISLFLVLLTTVLFS